MKTCIKCKAEFVGRRCNPCNRAISSAWNKANPEKAKAIHAAYYSKNSVRINADKSASIRANPEKAATFWKKYRACNKEKLKAKDFAYYILNKDKIILRNVAWAKANPEKVRAIGAVYRSTNHEKVRAQSAAWSKANPEAVRITGHNYRARKRANGGKLSKGLSAKLFKLQQGKCPCCSKPLGDNYHLDHIIPIKRGGVNEDWNIQLLRQQCNNQKCAKDPITFMQSKGFLI